MVDERELLKLRSYQEVCGCASSDRPRMHLVRMYAPFNNPNEA